ncbi:MAG: putative quinol monooxygenase [Planctomycetaceae bacterium]
MVCLTILLTVRDSADVDRVRDLLARAMTLSRREPGCERFDVYHSEAEPRRFTLVEHWASPEDLERHRTAEAYTQVYKPFVMPLVEREGHPSRLLPEASGVAGGKNASS